MNQNPPINSNANIPLNDDVHAIWSALYWILKWNAIAQIPKTSALPLRGDYAESPLSFPA